MKRLCERSNCLRLISSPNFSGKAPPSLFSLKMQVCKEVCLSQKSFEKGPCKPFTPRSNVINVAGSIGKTPEKKFLEQSNDVNLTSVVAHSSPPTNLFSAKSRSSSCVRVAYSSGITPCNAFARSCKTLNCDKFWSDAGNGPSNSLFDKSTLVSWFTSPNSEGISPVKRFSARSRSVNAVN